LFFKLGTFSITW